MNKRILALISNILIICLSSIVLLLSERNINILYHFEIDTNILSLVASLLFLIFLIIKKDIIKIPFIILILKFIAATSLILSIFIFMTQLIFQKDLFTWSFNTKWLLSYIINPLIVLISFIFFENDKRFNKKNNIYWPIIFLVIYIIVIITCHQLKIYDNPYYFLNLNMDAIYLKIILIILIIIIDYFIARILLIQNQKRVPRRNIKITK